VDKRGKTISVVQDSGEKLTRKTLGTEFKKKVIGGGSGAFWNGRAFEQNNQILARVLYRCRGKYSADGIPRRRYDLEKC